jgi:hypothetical protein
MNRHLVLVWSLAAWGIMSCAEDQDTPDTLSDASATADTSTVDMTADAGQDVSEMGADSGRPPARPFPNVDTLVDARVIPLQFGVGEFSFESPDDAVSLTVIIFGSESGAYGINSWVDPTDFELVVDNWPAIPGNESGCYSCANFVTQSAGVSTTLLPNRPDAVLRPGIHRIQIVGFENDDVAREATVTVLAKRLSEEPVTGTLDINFYFTGAQDWNATSVQTDPYFQAVIDRFSELYSQVGIEIGQMTFEDLADPSLRVISIASERDDLGQLVAHSNSDFNDALSVFFVEEILTGDPDTGDRGFSIPGVSAAVPGPPLMNGTVASGVAISTLGPLSIPPGQRFLDPPAIGQTLCHEVGHLLGLFHISEYDGTTHDVLEDTPDNDESYLMHPDGTGSIISPWQGRVMRSNPWVRHRD